MSVIPNGVTTETLNNLEFEAGLVLTEKYTGGDFDKSKVLCATTGGIKVNISAVRQAIKFDGLLENTAGLHRIIGYTGSVQFTTKEVDKDKVKRAIGYATEQGGVITLGQGVIPLTEYKDIYILGKMGDDSWRQICMEKTMNTVGLRETRNDKNEVEISFDLQANYGIDTQDVPPIKIEYIAAG
jgi:hypothetical protein